MPYLVMSSWYPSHKVSDVIKTFTEMLKKYPPSVIAELGEILVNNAGTSSEKGLKNMSVYDIKEGKLEEALKIARSALAMFQPIDGYESKVEVWSTAAEGFEAIGMQVPT